ncbi:MAG: hypothetical protein PPP55_06710, partial [Halorubrum sp.]
MRAMVFGFLLITFVLAVIWDESVLTIVGLELVGFLKIVGLKLVGALEIAAPWLAGQFRLLKEPVMELAKLLFWLFVVHQ